ncbi:uncharacterized protein E5676_scaffold767G00460 [Cucumis melo var. makuwa]|uniref:Uncharacterized protein n=1 Tax=Cucumis melo var. makuwa TaxID=1194695 RepID=A0A5D3BAB3_CUCMM|nr:uncharacterized protein E6C27_scaffold744G001580 [Cucumis melo var. makuwa]TYJ95551.1 uncharacterized protein E5676_scaffold767G00460 [Cucumis melo var. makuwa]
MIPIRTLTMQNNNVPNKEVESTRQDEQCGKASTQATSSTALPPPPFPGRLKKKGDDQQFYKLLDILKQLYINIPFVDALKQMSFYVKFLKDILVKKRRIDDCETVALMRATSNVFKNWVLKKMTNLGSFMVPCSIGRMDSGRACNLRASINLMPLSIFKKLKIEEVQQPYMRL